MNMETFFEKSQELASNFRESVQKNIPALKRLSPQNPNLCAGHLTFGTEHAQDVLKRLQEKNIFCDYRPPYLLRFSFSPLYLNIADVEIVTHILKEIMV
jgi:kynureninase